MAQFSSLRRSFRFPILAVCSAAIVTLTTPAWARSHHGARHHARSFHLHHYAERHRGTRHFARNLARTAPAYDSMDPARSLRFANANASIAPQDSSSANFGLSNIV